MSRGTGIYLYIRLNKLEKMSKNLDNDTFRAKDLIIQDYKMLFHASDEKKIQLLSIIIDLKRNYKQHENIKYSLYKDVKSFILLYYRNRRSKDYGYEECNTQLLVEYIQDYTSFNAEQIYKLFVYCKTVLNWYSYNDKWLDNYIYQAKLTIAKKNYWIKYILLLSSKNIFSILLTLLIMFSIECIVLSPAPQKWMELYNVSYADFSSCTIINHVLNIISLHFDCIDNAAKLRVTSFGLILLMLWYSIYILLGVNFLFKNLFANIHIDELD